MVPKSVANILRRPKINHESIFIGAASLNNQVAGNWCSKTTKRELKARPNGK